MILLWLFLVSLFVEGMVRTEPKYGGKTVRETGMVIIDALDDLMMTKQQEDLYGGASVENPLSSTL